LVESDIRVSSGINVRGETRLFYIPEGTIEIRELQVDANSPDYIIEINHRRGVIRLDYSDFSGIDTDEFYAGSPSSGVYRIWVKRLLLDAPITITVIPKTGVIAVKFFIKYERKNTVKFFAKYERIGKK